MKISAPCILSPLTFIFNKILSTGIFPDRLKFSEVKPLFKKGDKSEFSNYRPISLLTSFSKIIEKNYIQKIVSTLKTKINYLLKNSLVLEKNHPLIQPLMLF